MLTLASQKWHWHVKMLMHVLFYITDFRGRCVLFFPEHNVLLSRRFRWVWRSMFSRHLQSQIIHHKLLLSFWDFTITCVAVQGGFDFDGLCWVVPTDSQITQTALLWCSRYSRVHHHRLLCSSTRKETCVCVCACWLFRNVRPYFSPPDLIVPSRLWIHPENICWAVVFVRGDR